MAAELIQNDKLKGGCSQKTDRVASFFLEKLCFPCVRGVKPAYFTSRSCLLLSRAYRCDAVQGKRAGAWLDSCIFNGIITYILKTEYAFLCLN